MYVRVRNQRSSVYLHKSTYTIRVDQYILWLKVTMEEVLLMTVSYPNKNGVHVFLDLFLPHFFIIFHPLPEAFFQVLKHKVGILLIIEDMLQGYDILMLSLLQHRNFSYQRTRQSFDTHVY